MSAAPTSSLTMSVNPEHIYAAACGKLATQLGVSLAAARNRVDILAAKAGNRDPAAKLELVEHLLEEAISNELDHDSLFNNQLQPLRQDLHFMVED